MAIHLGAELAVVSERNPSKLGFEIFISLKIFERNSQVRFDKRMTPSELEKSPVHDLMHSQLFNPS